VTDRSDGEERAVQSNEALSRHDKMTTVFVISPTFNEAENIPVLYERLGKIANDLFDRYQFRFLFVDDCSTDGTPRVLAELCSKDPRVAHLRLSRNSGSHAALTAGFAHCDGDCAVVLAADGQDPPETLPALLEEWRRGSKVVWAVRETREGVSRLGVLCSRLFYWIMRRIALAQMPPEGADFFLVDRQVIAALNRMPEHNHSVVAMLMWLGFPQSSIQYTKERRLHGLSKWSFGKRLKLAIDSFAGYSYVPLRAASVLGLTTAALGLLYALFVFVTALFGRPVTGWASLMVVVLTTAGVQMMILGVLGEYLWRVLEETRRRPRYVIESSRNLRASTGDGTVADGVVGGEGIQG